MEGFEEVLAALQMHLPADRFQRQPLYRSHGGTFFHIGSGMTRNRVDRRDTKGETTWTPIGDYYYEAMLSSKGNSPIVQLMSFKVVSIYNTAWLIDDQPVEIRLSIEGDIKLFEVEAYRPIVRYKGNASGQIPVYGDPTLRKEDWKALTASGTTILYHSLEREGTFG